MPRLHLSEKDFERVRPVRHYAVRYPRQEAFLRDTPEILLRRLPTHWPARALATAILPLGLALAACGESPDERGDGESGSNNRDVATDGVLKSYYQSEQEVARIVEAALADRGFTPTPAMDSFYRGQGGNESVDAQLFANGGGQEIYVAYADRNASFANVDSFINDDEDGMVENSCLAVLQGEECSQISCGEDTVGLVDEQNPCAAVGVFPYGDYYYGSPDEDFEQIYTDAVQHFLDWCRDHGWL